MKSPLFRISTLILAIMSLCGCTCNDGDIGNWFGTWHLDEMTIGGETDTSYGGDLFWQFQNNVFCMRKVTEYHEYYPRWGTWAEIDGKTLRLDFTHHDDKYPPGSDWYSPWPETHLKAKGISDLTKITMNGDRM